MNTKRIISLVASLALVLSLSVGLTGCGDKAAQDDNQGSTDGEGTKYTVGICQLVQHEALDAATQGFIDALNEALPGQVEFQNKNASGDSANCSTIVNGFVSDGVDLIMANATEQKAAGYKLLTDGEFRRKTWYLDFMWGFEGVSHAAPRGGIPFTMSLRSSMTRTLRAN